MTPFLSHALFAVALTTAAQAHAQRVDIAASDITFVTRMMGAPVEGRFTRWDATLQFDPQRLETASLALRIDVTGATFASPEVGAEAQRAVWFDGARFAHAQFQSTTVKALGGGRYELAGRLSLKGQTRELIVPVTLVHTGTTARARGSFGVKRLDFGIGSGEWADASLVAHEVLVRFDIALSGLVAP